MMDWDPEVLLARENAVLRNILRETSRVYETRLTEGFGDGPVVARAQPEPEPEPEQPSDLSTDEEQGPPLSDAERDEVLENLVHETTLGYEGTRRDLETLRGHLSTLLAAVDEAVVRTDARANIVDLNPVAERMTGWRSSVAQGRPLIDVLLFNDASGQAMVLDLAPTLLSGESQKLDMGLSLERRDGRLFAVTVGIEALPDLAGEVVGLLLLLREVGEVPVASLPRLTLP